MVLRFENLRNGFACFALVVSAALAFGCSQGSDIQLQGPAPTVQVPGQDSVQPSTPANTDDTSSAPKDPATPPLPARYRVMCDDRYPPYVMAISSLASPTGFGAGIEVGELDAAGKFDPLTTHNLEYHENVQIVSLPKFGEARVLFAAKRMHTNPNYNGQGRRYIFVSDLDLTARGGIAKFIANEVPVDSRTASFASRESLSVRTFGVSDGGRYLLIGQGDGYRLVDSTTLQALGTLKVGGADTNINPSLREADMVFSVASSNGTSFTSKLYSIGLNSSGGVKNVSLVSTVNLLRRPLVAIRATAGESFAALDTSNRIVIVSPLKPAALTKSLIAAIPAKGRLASSIAFWRAPTTNSLRAVVVFENFVPDSGGLFRKYKIEQVFVRVLEIDETKLSADAFTSDYDYPSESKQTVEMGISTGMVPGVSDLRASTDGEAIFGLFPGSLSSQLYRLTSAGLVRVSQDACKNFSIGREL